MVAKAMFLGQKLFSKHIIVMHGQVHQYKRVLSYCLKTNKSDNVNYSIMSITASNNQYSALRVRVDARVT